MSGVELFGLAGSIQSTIEILGQVITTIRSFLHQEKDEKDSRLKSKAHSRTLQQLVPALERIQATSRGPDISLEDQKLSNDIEAHLKDIQAGLKSELDVASMEGKSRFALGSRAAQQLQEAFCPRYAAH